MHSAASDIVLLTGASGRLGQQLGGYLKTRGFKLRALVKNDQAVSDHFEAKLEWRVAQTDSAAVDALLEGVASVVHLASSGVGDEQAQRDAHLGMPELLLEAAARSSVSRFIALSSIKAIAGEASEQALGLAAKPAPTSDYGRFKLRAETLLREHAANAGLATFTLRLPMVYGPGASGNFSMLRKAARLRLPLPVATDNQRSVLFSENLFAGITHLLSEPQAPGHKLVHLADGAAISTKLFFQLIAAAEGSRGWSVTLPGRWGQSVASIPLLGDFVGGVAERLLGSLRFEQDSLNHIDGWEIPYTTAEGIRAAINPDA